MRTLNATTMLTNTAYEQASTRNTGTNPSVGGKLAVSDCSQVTDGASVILLGSNKLVNEKNIEKDSPIIKGWGHRVAPMNFTDKVEESRDNAFILPWTRQTIVDAYQRAQLTVNDMDFFEVHDCFTSSEYVSVSNLGITKPGEEYKAVESGEIEMGGKFPINPSGGLIGVGHPVGASGVRMFLDLYKQVTNKAGTYQVDGAKNGLMLNIGGTATTNYAFIIGMKDEAN